MLSPQLTDPQPNRQSSAAPLRPLAPLDSTQALISSVLREGLMRDNRTFDPIQRPANGADGWCTLKRRCLDSEAVAAKVLDPDLIIGLRHRYQVRLVAVDLDNHHGQQNWRPDHPSLRALTEASEAAGIVPTLTATPNGMHLWMSLPETVPVVRAHWLVRELLRRAQVGPQVGPVEVFPSLTTGSPIVDPKARPASHGIRLPGQAGSALWVGDRWAEEPIFAWQELEAALLSTETGPAWDELREAAAALERQHKRPSPAGRVSRPQARPQAHDEGAPIQWTAAGQSNRLLFDLGNRGYRRGRRDPEALAAHIESEALAAPGFHRWASADTKGRLGPWARQKAEWILRHPPAGKARSDDPGRNHRLRQQSLARVASGAFRAARCHGVAAVAWSERKVAHYLKLTRKTYRKLRQIWRLRLTAAACASTLGTHPRFKGVGLGSLAVLSESIHPSVLGPAGSGCGLSDHHRRPPSTADPPPMPTSASTVVSLRRQSERDELARWLSAVSA